MTRSIRRALGAFALLAAAAGPLAAQPASLTLDAPRCATPEPSPEAAARAHAEVAAWLAGNDAAVRSGGLITVPIAYHIITNGPLGAVPQARLDDQTVVLNDAFAPMGIRFVNAFQETVDDAVWFGAERDSPEEAAMKSALALDPAVYLNLYTLDAVEELGWASRPESGAETDLQQGVVVLHSTLPGGTRTPYDEGDTATHEVGHWVGLFHTFQGGCTGFGDGVADTPAVASPNFGCPVGVDSCPGEPGLDPVDNFMDYVDDDCMVRFTEGQGDRARVQMAIHRPTIVGADGVLLDPGALAFGPVPVGGEAVRNVRLVNLADTDRTVVDVRSTNDVFAPDPTPFVLPAGGTATVAVAFAPDAAGPATAELRFVTTDPDVGVLPMEVSGEGILAPVLGGAPLALFAAAEPGAETLTSLTLTNDGAGDLAFSFGGGATARRGGGGPDAFGYTWVDSNALGGPVFDFQDISATGTPLTLGDEESVEVTLPFDFPFYGDTFRSVRVVSNGFLTLGPPTTAFENAPIPTAADPNGLIAPFWDDFSPNLGGEVSTQDLSDGRFVVQWTDVPFYEGDGAAATFQAVLHASGEILFQYLSVSGREPSATVGLESPDGTDGLQVAFDAPYLEDGLAVRFTSAPPWLTGLDPASGTVGPGETLEVLATFSAVGLDAGVVQGLVELLSNDPVRPAQPVHAVFAVGGALAPPALASPLYGVDQVPVDVALTWLPAPGADSYEVEVARDAGFTVPVTSGTVAASPFAFEAGDGRSYVWRVRSRDGAASSPWSVAFPFTVGTATGTAVRPERSAFALGAPFPNPASGRVSLPLTLDASADVRVRVFDVTGRELATLARGPLAEGAHLAVWDTARIPAGVYLIRAEAGGDVRTVPVVVAR